MGIENLDKLFHPSSIALVGASEKQGRIGTALLRNLIQGGFQGRIYPVNPKYRRVMNLQSFASVNDVDEVVDLAIIAIPIEGVPGVIGACSAAGVKTAIIVSGGGREAGTGGLAVEKEIAEAAASGSMRIVGPNCLGLMSPGSNLNASFSSAVPLQGNLGFISQSGGICTSLLDLSGKEGIGFSCFVSIGSMLDVDFGDLIDFLGKDSLTRSILLYIEQITDVRKFISASRAVSRIKPIIALKSGSSPAAARAAASHTGALVSDDAAYDAVFKRAGVIRVSTIEDLFDCAEAMAKQSRPRGSSMTVITNGGGPGVMAVDAMARYGIEPAVLPDHVIVALDRVLPSYWSKGNPVDMTGGASAERYAQVTRLVLEGTDSSSLLIIFAPQAVSGPEEVVEHLLPLLSSARIPVFCVWMGGREVSSSVEALNHAGIVTYETPERAVKVLGYMVKHNRNVALSTEIPPRLEQHLSFDRIGVSRIISPVASSKAYLLPELQARSILCRYGFNLNPATAAGSVEEAVSVAEQLGWPVTMKVLSPDITHKSEVKGVHLDLRNPADIRAGYDRILREAHSHKPSAVVEGVTLQPHICDPDCELVMGVKRDDMLGPIILFGMGGIFTEIISDSALGLPPLNRLLARDIMKETRIYKVLLGFRNRPKADLASLETMLLQLSQLAVDFPEIAELDLNPVLVKNGSPVVVDARIILRTCSKSSPLHLVISPYPAHYELCTITSSGKRILIRPIRPEDADLFAELFCSLSPSSVYFRFFQHIRELSPEMLSMLTQVDYDRHMALVAIDLSGDREKMLGVARIIADPDITHCEFSILIGDQWQGQGIGEQLLLYLLKVAKKQGVRTIWGTVLPENTNMLRLAKKLNFETKFDRDEHAYQLCINVTRTNLDA